MDNLLEMREMLSNDVASKADWRSQKAEEYPDDHRNSASAESLRALLAYAGELSDDHPIFGALALFGESDDDIYEAIELQNALLSRYGFDGEEDPEEFLQNLASELKKTLGTRPKVV